MSIIIFDKKSVRQKRTRARANIEKYDFLMRRATKLIAERLDDVKRDFPSALQIGLRGGKIEHPKIGMLFTMEQAPGYGADFIADEEFLPIKQGNLDLIVSPLCLHHINDLPGTLLQIRKALRPDGLFIAAMFGGETLHELRDCLMNAELDISGGISPRVAPFADKQQMGALMQRAGFALPVVDSEIFTVTYEHMFALCKDLRGMGETLNVKERAKGFSPRALFPAAAQLYAERFAEEDGRIPASFEMIFLLGWAPHDSQQKPLQPGSAKNRLADALGTKEGKL